MRLFSNFNVFIVLCVIFLIFGLEFLVDRKDTVERKCLTLWTVSLKPYFTDYMEKVLSEFTAEEGIDVCWIDVPFSVISQKFISSVLAGDEPDVINLPVSWAYNFYYKGLLETISPDKLEGNYLPATLTALNFDGEVIAVPWYVNVKVLLCNREILERVGSEPPSSFDEIIELSKLTGHDYLGTWFYLKFEQDVQALAGSFCEGGKLRFDSLRVVQLMRNLRRWYSEGLIDRSAVLGHFDEAFALFLSGKTACIIIGPQFIKRVERENPDLFEKLIVKRIPFENPPITMMVLAVPSGVRDKGRAFRLAEFLASTENQVMLSELAPVLPSTVDGIKEILSSCDRDISDIYQEARCISARQLLSSKVYELKLPMSKTRGELYKGALYRIFEGRGEVEQILRDLHGQVVHSFEVEGYRWQEIQRIACQVNR